MKQHPYLLNVPNVIFNLNYPNILYLISCRAGIMWTPIPNVYSPPIELGHHLYMFPLLDNEKEHIGHIIGKNGFYFKQLTHNTFGVSYIWYNEYNGMIELWTEYKFVQPNIIFKILRHISHIMKSIN